MTQIHALFLLYLAKNFLLWEGQDYCCYLLPTTQHHPANLHFLYIYYCNSSHNYIYQHVFPKKNFEKLRMLKERLYTQ